MTDMERVTEEVFVEVSRGMKVHGDYYNSAHEAYAVLKEEVDELWDEVKKKSHNRDMSMMRREAVQIAAVAIRIAFQSDVKWRRETRSKWRA